MIKKEQLLKLMNKGVDVIEYLLLFYLWNNVDVQDLMVRLRIKGKIVLMLKKEWIESIGQDIYRITKKGEEILNSVADGNELEEIVQEQLSSATEEKFSFEKWSLELHKELENKLFELVGAKQVRRKINGRGKAYSFLCNAKDLYERIGKYVIRKYGCNDLNKIKLVLLQYIERCVRDNDYFPQVCYYIHKEGKGSELYTDICNFEEGEKVEDKPSIQRFV